MSTSFVPNYGDVLCWSKIWNLILDLDVSLDTFNIAFIYTLQGKRMEVLMVNGEHLDKLKAGNVDAQCNEQEQIYSNINGETEGQQCEVGVLLCCVVRL